MSIFVGSIHELTLAARNTPYGKRERIEIWGKDIDSNLRLLHKNAAYLNPLNPDDIEGGEVIPYFENIRLPQKFFRLLPIPTKKETGLNFVPFK